MHTPCALAENELRSQLTFPTTAPALADLVADIRARMLYGPRTRYVLDCSAVEDLSAAVLATLAELRNEGCDLTLANCPASLRKSVLSSALGSLLAEQTATHAAHPLRGPHASFARRFRQGA
jgi:anti-anti-sigma regulatory factor